MVHLAFSFSPIKGLNTYGSGNKIAIDVKGVRTKEYITKKKVFEDKYNMKIIEI